MSLASATAALMSANNTFEVFAVFRPTTIGVGSGSLWTHSSIWNDTGLFIGHIVNTNIGRMYWFSNTTPNVFEAQTPNTMNALQIQSYRRPSSTTIRGSTNGVYGSTTTVTALGSSTGTLRLNQSFDQDLCELVMITDLAESDRVTGYLAHKWGLAGDLPAAHPFKSAAP
jgi:hypothetical protein